MCEAEWEDELRFTSREKKSNKNIQKNSSLVKLRQIKIRNFVFTRGNLSLCTKDG